MIYYDDSNLDSTKESHLYWIHKKNHTNINTEGYVGISIAPLARYRNHMSLLSKPYVDSGYSSRFIRSFKKQDLFMEIIDSGDKEYICNLEEKLRPTYNIGYNVVPGGAGAGLCLRYKHGGTSDLTNYYRFLRLIDYCEINNLYVDPIFLLPTGFQTFSLNRDKSLDIDAPRAFYKLIDYELGFVINNYCLDVCTVNSDHSEFVKYKDKLLSKKEAYNFTDTSKTNIKKRLQKGWTPEQAFGFEPSPLKNFKIISLGGVDCKYDLKSTYSVEVLQELFSLYRSRSLEFYSKCEDNNVHHSNILRYFKRYKLLNRDISNN